MGLVGVGNILAAPASAGQAAARGAVTVVRPSGSSISVSAELVAAEGTEFTGALAVDVVGSTGAGTNQETITGITVTPGGVQASSATAPAATSIEAAIAAQLVSGTAIEDQAALVRAVYANGYSGLD